MKFGILYNTDYYPEVHGSASQYYGQILDQVQLEEELGFDAVWFGEHHYSGYSFGSPPVMAMAAAARTKRIRLGTGVSLIPLNHPIRLAEEYAMLDVLSGGRLEYGIGRGFLKYSHEIFGVNEDENHERYHEGTEIILKAWTAEGPFSYQGKFWTLQDYTFFPKPLQQPHPPIILGTLSTKGLHRVVRYCDGWIPTGVSIQDLPAAIKDLHARAEQAGRKPSDVLVSIFGALNDEAVLRHYQELGVERVVLTVPSREKDRVLPLLDTYAAFLPTFA